MAAERHYVSFSHPAEDDLDTDSLSESADHDPLRSGREILRRTHTSLLEVCVFFMSAMG